MPGFANTPSGTSIMWADNVDFSGAHPATNAITTNGQLLIGSTIAPNIQPGILISPNNSISIGYSSPNITLTSGSAVATTYTTNSGNAIPAGNILNVLGTSAAAGTSPLSTSGAGNTVTIIVQNSQAIAATDATKIGLAAFNSTFFTVDANGFVSANGSGLGETITGDSGGALSPTAGNWNILGRSGSKTSGSGSTLTVKSPPYADAGSSTTSTLNSGSFVTAAITLTLPASIGLADGDLFEYVCTVAGPLVIQAVGTQKIRLGNSISSAAGTATSTLIGDSISLRFRATDGFFYATSSIGTWILA